tara:strand:+ start:1622 stop:2206 length:585 start_codon:yes stop_codon:yes gene_type:complete
MSKSILIQTLILSLIIIIIFFSYKFFFYENETKQVNISSKTEKNNIKKKEDNLIEDLNYNSRDDNGNIYEIFSETGLIDEKDVNILYLKNVKAVIKIKNSGIVNVYSNFAKYNKANLNTHFYDNVSLKFKDHNITSNNIHLNYLAKKIKITNNISYYDKNNKMKADVIEFDLLTKMSRVYMLNKNSKIKGLIKN